MKYDGKIRGTFKLCRVLSVDKDEDGLVRTVRVGFQSKSGNKKKTGENGEAVDYPKLEVLEVGVPRLCLIVPAEGHSEE